MLMDGWFVLKWSAFWVGNIVCFCRVWLSVVLQKKTWITRSQHKGCRLGELLCPSILIKTVNEVVPRRQTCNIVVLVCVGGGVHLHLFPGLFCWPAAGEFQSKAQFIFEAILFQQRWPKYMHQLTYLGGWIKLHSVFFFTGEGPPLCWEVVPSHFRGWAGGWMSFLSLNFWNHAIQFRCAKRNPKMSWPFTTHLWAKLFPGSAPVQPSDEDRNRCSVDQQTPVVSRKHRANWLMWGVKSPLSKQSCGGSTFFPTGKVVKGQSSAEPGIWDLNIVSISPPQAPFPLADPVYVNVWGKHAFFFFVLNPSFFQAK